MAIRLFLSTSLMALVLVLAGCGGGQKQNEAAAACANRCNLELMTCLEKSSCLDADGHAIVCQEECDTKKTSCDEACAR